MSTTPERFAQIKELLLAARELPARDDSAHALLDEGIVKLRPQSKLPERIGIYEIEAILGEGGMGVVYRARQEEPIRRKVALQLIRRGMHSESAVRRYAVGRGSPIEGFGIWNHKKFPVVMELDGWAAAFAREREWSQNQSIEDHGDRIVLSFWSTSRPEVQALVLSFGANARLVEPKELADDTAKEIEAMGEKYGRRG
jgi:serine/threonine protein kinase